jgi:transposase
MLKDNYYSEPSAVDLLIFERLVPADHYLRRVKDTLDFEPLRPLLNSRYKPNQGRPAEDPVRMFKFAFLQFHYKLSDREVIAQAQVNVAMRFFLDLALDSPLPDPSSLSVFRARLGDELFEQLFNEIVAIARRHKLVKDRLRLKDATHIIASITVPTTTQLVAEMRARLLESARPFAAERVSSEELEAEHIRLATSDLPDQERLLQRVHHLRRIIAWADTLKISLGAADPLDKQRLAFEQALQLAHKVLLDRDEAKRGDKLLCLSDPEARTGMHHGYYSGYMLDVLVDADSEIITAIAVLAANGDEAADAGQLIAQEEAAHKNDVQLLSIDKAGWRGELLAEWRDQEGLGLEVIVPPAALSVARGYFTADEFILDAASGELRCPGGKTTSRRSRHAKNPGWQYQFKKQDCAGCALRERCLSGAGKEQGRGVLKNDYAGELQAARSRATTALHQQVRVEHRRVEGKLAELVWRHGGRFARYRGRARLRVQYLMLGMVVNIKRMVNKLCPQQGRERRLMTA